MLSSVSMATLKILFWRDQKGPAYAELLNKLNLNNTFVEGVLMPIVDALSLPIGDERSRMLSIAMVHSIGAIDKNNITVLKDCGGAVFEKLHYIIIDTMCQLYEFKDYLVDGGLSVLDMASTFVGEKLMACLIAHDLHTEVPDLCNWVHVNPVFESRLPPAEDLMGLFIQLSKKNDDEGQQPKLFRPADSFSQVFHDMTHNYLTEVIKHPNIVIAGGIVKKIIMGITDIGESDVDLWIVGARSSDEVAKVVNDVLEQLLLDENDISSITLCGSTLTIYLNNPDLRVQIPLRAFKSINQILASFDVAPVRCAFAQGSVHMTQSCIDAIATMAMPIDPSMSTYSMRYAKQLADGFRIICPRVPSFHHADKYIRDITVVSKRDELIRVYNGHLFGILALLTTSTNASGTVDVITLINQINFRKNKSSSSVARTFTTRPVDVTVYPTDGVQRLKDTLKWHVMVRAIVASPDQRMGRGRPYCPVHALLKE